MNQCGGCGVEIDSVRTNCGPECANKMANDNLAGRLVRVVYSTARDGEQDIIGSMDAPVEVEARMDREEPGWRARDAALLHERG